MYVCITIMSILSFSITKGRENLFDLLSNHPDYSGFTKADLLEAGLNLLLQQTREEKQETKESRPYFLDDKAVKEFYEKPMTKEEFKKIDAFINQVMIWHNKKFKDDKWL